jgi:hypothetical protein
VDVPGLMATLRLRERLVQVADEGRREAERRCRQHEVAAGKAEAGRKSAEDKAAALEGEVKALTAAVQERDGRIAGLTAEKDKYRAALVKVGQATKDALGDDAK